MTQLAALFISLAIEVPIVLILALTIQRMSPNELLRLSILACGATLLTHPVAWTINQILIAYVPFLVRAALIESIVIIAEGILYKQVLTLAWQQGIFISAIANVTSFLGGLVIYELL